jgi:hypothetical protein
MPKNEVLAMGENIRVSTEGNELVIRIDTSVRLRPSGSGKNTLIATMGAPALIPGTAYKLGLTLFTK